MGLFVRWRPACAAALLWALAGCSNPAGPSGAQGQLDESRRKWDERGLTDYQYQYQNICFCAPAFTNPVVVSVSRGAIVAAVDVQSGRPVDASDLGRYRSVPQVFDVIQDAIDRKAARIEASYDPTFGHPTDVSIDYDRMIADEELGIRIRDLRPR